MWNMKAGRVLKIKIRDLATVERLFVRRDWAIAAELTRLTNGYATRRGLKLVSDGVVHRRIQLVDCEELRPRVLQNDDVCLKPEDALGSVQRVDEQRPLGPVEADVLTTAIVGWGARVGGRSVVARAVDSVPELIREAVRDRDDTLHEAAQALHALKLMLAEALMVLCGHRQHHGAIRHTRRRDGESKGHCCRDIWNVDWGSNLVCVFRPRHVRLGLR